MRHLCALSPCLLLLVACDGVATQTDLALDADPVSRSRAGHVWVRLDDQDGEERFSLEQPLGADGVELPSLLPVVPRNGDATRTFSVVAELRQPDHTPFSWQRATLGFVAGERSIVDIVFTDACIGIECTPDTTCREGVCVDASTVAPADERGVQPGLCDGELCWEHPRPGPSFFTTVCKAGPTELVVGSRGAAVRTREGVWVQEMVGTSEGLQGVECWDDGQAIAVGRRGTARQWRDGAWMDIDWDPGVDLRAVSGASPSEAWVVGDAGTVLRRDGAGWEQLTPPTSEDLFDVYAPSAAEAYVAGANGTLLHFSAGSWDMPMPPSETVLSVTGRPGEVLIVAGSADATDGAVHRLEGARFVPVLSTSGAGFVDVDVDASGWAAAAGGRGAQHVRTPDGEWTRVDPGLGANLSATAAGEGVALFVARGRIWRWDGATSLEESFTLTLEDLHAVALAPEPDAGEAAAVGEEGTILWRAPEGRWHLEVIPSSAADSVHRGALLDVGVVGSTFVAVGTGGAIAERALGPEGGWQLVDGGTDVDLSAVATGDGEAVAVGADGVVLQRDGDGRWAAFRPAFPSSAQLTSALYDESGALYVGAASGEVWRQDSAGWSSLGSVGGPVQRLRLWNDEVYVCGPGLFRDEGDTLIPQTTPDTTDPIRDVGFEGDTPRWFLAGGSLVERTGDGFTRRSIVGLEAIAQGAGQNLAVGSTGQIVRMP